MQEEADVPKPSRVPISSVVMKYFVSDRFRLLCFLIATKGAACRELYVYYFDFSVRRTSYEGPACRELYVWYFDFSVRKRVMRARYAVS